MPRLQRQQIQFEIDFIIDRISSKTVQTRDRQRKSRDFKNPPEGLRHKLCRLIEKYKE